MGKLPLFLYYIFAFLDSDKYNNALELIVS